MGADYRRQFRQPLGGVEHVGIAAGLTRYMAPWGGIHFGLVGDGQVRFAVAGILDQLYYDVNGAPGAGENFTITLMVNGNAVTLTCQIAGAVAVANTDLVNADIIAAGDEVCIRIVTSGAAAVVNHRWGLRFRNT